jgi:Protein of unknown function (DUF664)/Bacteriocin-protection, YdeI or OmpD-Associated/Domain of unknown function (DUF1905)
MRKIDGLTDTQLRTPVEPLGWSPLGLVQHLGWVERRWMRWGFAAEDIVAYHTGGDAAEWSIPAEQTAASIVSAYFDEADRSRVLMAGAGFAQPARMGGRFKTPDDAPSLGRILFHLLQEYAPHVGHLDIARELIDGETANSGIRDTLWCSALSGCRYSRGGIVKEPPRDGTGSAGGVEGGRATRFRATLELGGKTATGIRVPVEVVASLGQSKRPAVRVTIKGHTYRTSVASVGGQFMLPVSAEQREAAGVLAGDVLDVDIELDTEPREVTVPADLTDALDRDVEARRFFDGLSYTHKRWYVLWIEGAKKEDTRQGRIAKAVIMLAEGRQQG